MLSVTLLAVLSLVSPYLLKVALRFSTAFIAFFNSVSALVRLVVSVDMELLSTLSAFVLLVVSVVIDLVNSVSLVVNLLNSLVATFVARG